MTQGQAQVVLLTGHPPPARAQGLRELAADFALASTSGDVHGARRALACLFDLRGKFPSMALLRAVADGRRQLVWRAPLYLLNAAACSDRLHQDLADAIAACSRFLELEAPTILLDCTAELDGLHVTIESFPGLALIKLSTQSKQFPDQLRFVVFHEVAHAFLSCGVRLMDEGLACLAAERFSGQEPLPGQAAPGLSLRTLLSSAASQGLFFEGADASIEQAEPLRKLGARLVSHVHQRLGPTGVKALFYALAQAGTDNEITALVEQAIGQSLDSFHVVDMQSCAGGEIVGQALQQSFLAYRSEAPHEYDEIIERLTAQRNSADTAILDALIGALIARAVLQLNLGQQVAADAVALIDVLIQEAKSLPEARLWTLRGHRAVLALKLEKGNFVKAATYSKKAVTAYSQALALNAADPDPIIGRALLYINTPAQYGGDRDQGLGMLRQLLPDQLYGGHAGAILQRLGALPAPAQPAPRQAAGSEVVMAVSGLKVKLSDSFSVDIRELAVHRGERIALVGRNGSGKTALLETILGLRPADSGRIALLSAGAAGSVIERNRQLGASLQQVGLFSNMYVREIVRMHQAVYGAGSPRVHQALGLPELMALKYQVLSRGQTQRVQLYLAMAHQPALLLLDEPSLGLDEWFAGAMRALWSEWEMTVLFISHVPADIEAMDRLIVIDDGRIGDEGTLDELRTRYTGRFKIRVLQALSARALEELQQLPGTTMRPEEKNGHWTLFGGDRLVTDFRLFIERHGLLSYSIERASTEDFLARLTRQ